MSFLGSLGRGSRGRKERCLKRAHHLRSSRFFFRYLPYWKEFEIGRAIDIMHVEKGVFENTIGLLLDIPSKTKDGLSACKDLQAIEKKGRATFTRKTEWKGLPSSS
jgi:hypothetical protein